jgi:AbrB family looped-hinge helix DNA binding protein
MGERLVRLKQRGQITLPLEIRKRLQLNEGDLFEVHVDERRVVLEPVVRSRPLPVWNPAEQLSELAGITSLGGNALEDTERWDE